MQRCCFSRWKYREREREREERIRRSCIGARGRCNSAYVRVHTCVCKIPGVDEPWGWLIALVSAHDPPRKISNLPNKFQWNCVAPANPWKRARWKQRLTFSPLPSLLPSLSPLRQIRWNSLNKNSSPFFSYFPRWWFSLSFSSSSGILFHGIPFRSTRRRKPNTFNVLPDACAAVVSYRT